MYNLKNRQNDEYIRNYCTNSSPLTITLKELKLFKHRPNKESLHYKPNKRLTVVISSYYNRNSTKK
jgi:hypothetical protein